MQIQTAGAGTCLPLHAGRTQRVGDLLYGRWGRLRNESALSNLARQVPLLAAILFLAARFALPSAAADPDAAPNSGQKQTLYYIPHTHWEGAVFKTREQYLQMGIPRILQVLRMLKEYPDYKFTLDQVCLVKPFLERY